MSIDGIFISKAFREIDSELQSDQEFVLKAMAQYRSSIEKKVPFSLMIQIKTVFKETPKPT